jgi:hypothetical protein
MRPDFDKRVKVLEARHHVDLAGEEAAARRLFYAKFTTDELRRLIAIGERNEAGSPPTVEERQFIDDLEARYGTF